MTDLPPHTEAHPDVAGYLLGTLTAEEEAAFAAHLEHCPPCRAELDELGDLPGLLVGLPPAEIVPPGLEARTFEAIERAAALSAGSGGDPGGGRSGVVVPLRPARSEPHPARRRRWIMTAAAAVIVAVIGVGVLSQSGTSRPAPVAVVQLAAPAGGGAHGTATIRAVLEGLTIDMNVRGLAAPAPGTFYTCWLVGPGDTLTHQNRVSVGSFVVNATGTADVHWTTGADLRRFPTLGVTLEPDNGNPLHQGPKVLQQV